MTGVQYMQLAPKQVISFNDFKYFITQFTGAKSENIQTWFTRFESLSNAFHFSEMQKFIFIERALKELAFFVQSEGITL